MSNQNANDSEIFKVKALDVQAAVEQILVISSNTAKSDGQKEFEFTTILTELVAEKWTATALRKRAEMSEALVAEKDREIETWKSANRIEGRLIQTTLDRAEQAEAALAQTRKALEAIRDFGHAARCAMTSVPVYECGCYDISQREIAERTLSGSTDETGTA